MLRRHFLLAAPAAAAQTGSRRPVNIGFLGISHSHGKAKLDLVRGSPEWNLVGVTEADTRLTAGLPLLSRRDLLAHAGIEVIAVESAVRDHGPDGLAVADAGKHLHLEKAPARDMPTFRRIATIAREKKLLLQVGYMWRYHSGINKLLEAARSGWLGDIYFIRGAIGNLLEGERRPEWAEFPGGNMFELGGHIIDPIARLMGRPVKVTPFLRTEGKFRDNLRDNTAAVLEWKSAMAIVHGANLQPNSGRYRALEIHGTNGTAVLNPIEPPALTIQLQNPAGPYQRGLTKVELAPYTRYVEDFAELAAALRGGAPLRTTYDEDLLVHETLLRASGML
jgi:predicted dehydrogenase